VAISAQTGEGMDSLVQELEVRLQAWRMRVQFRIPNEEQALIAEIHRAGHVLSTVYEDSDVLLTAHIPPELQNRFRQFEIPPLQT